MREQGVSDIQRVKVKINGELLTTDTYILTFEKCERPRVIKLSDWHSELVDKCKPRSHYCFNCVIYGDVAKYCRKKPNLIKFRSRGSQD